MTTDTVTYHSKKELNVGIERWKKIGYRVISITETPQPAGVARILTIGIGASFIKPSPYYHVTYEKE
jgi:hypothetical protein